MVKPKSFRPWNPEQTLLLPPSPVDWLLENHLVFFLLDLAAEPPGFRKVVTPLISTPGGLRT